LVRAGRS